jgi:cell division cycle protein 20 (cofactor of APC complex)
MIRRSVSISESLRSVTTTYPEASAHNFLRNTKVTVDFSPPSITSIAPIASSVQGILFFTRGNRVHLKNFDSGDIVSQLCRIPDDAGELRAIECASTDYPNFVALGTSKGCVHIYDVSTRKKTSSWTTRSLSSMAWNGPVLSVGTSKGTIRHFDLRVKETSKMKQQARKLTRHQSTICSLKWNVDGKFLAGGDESGNVYCWDSRQNIPLEDIGEAVQRRKKMQHPGPVTVRFLSHSTGRDTNQIDNGQALAWCPWKPKILASGDSATNGTGILRVWNIGGDATNAYPAAQMRQLDAQITSIQWSTTCKELLTTHGPGKLSDEAEARTQLPSLVNSDRNSITVHSYSSLRQVARVSLSQQGLGRSTLNSNGTKVIVAVPAEGKLKMCEVWGKAKEIKRQPSFMEHNSIR